MKKLFSLLLTLVLMLQMSVVAFAAAPATVAFSSEDATRGDTVTVTVALDGFSGVKSMMLTPAYDESALELVSGRWVSDAMDEAPIAVNWSKSSGNAVACFDDNTAVSGAVFALQFKVKDTACAGAASVGGTVVVKTLDGAAEVDAVYQVEAGAVNIDGGACRHKNSMTVEAVAAGCSETGYTAGVYCNDCKTYISGHTVIDAAGHKAVLVIGAAATCTESGLTDGSVCSVCGMVISAQQTIPPKGHTQVDDKCNDCGSQLALQPFTDVSDNDYYCEAVLWAVGKGVTTGVAATVFGPSAACTRGQVVTFLWRAMGKPAAADRSNPFSDIKSSDYYYEAVLWAREKGITGGTSATTFSPNDPCTRAQVATFLWRTMNKPAPGTQNNPFNDVAGDLYYYEAVLWAVENEITSGVGDGKFAPDDTCTRGQIATFLYRALA